MPTVCPYNRHPMDTPAQVLAEVRAAIRQPADTEAWKAVAQCLAKAFRVTANEVAIFRREGEVLRFMVPERLKATGTIPLTAATNSVVARTAITKRAEVINNFLATKHISLFETIKLDDVRLPIHKLMSAPVVRGNECVGVVQVSRKGAPDAQIVDFSPADLQLLTQSAGELVEMF